MLEMNEKQRLVIGLFENPNDKNQLNCMIDKDVDEVLITKLIANTVFKLNCTHN